MTYNIDGVDYELKKITFDVMYDFIEKNHPEDKAWFKKVAFEDKDENKVEKYQHLTTVRKFLDRYFDLPPAKAKEPKKSDKLKNW